MAGWLGNAGSGAKRCPWRQSPGVCWGVGGGEVSRTVVTWTAGKMWEVMGEPDTHSSTPSLAIKTHFVGSRGLQGE